jgi:hypothetical protein
MAMASGGGSPARASEEAAGLEPLHGAVLFTHNELIH